MTADDINIMQKIRPKVKNQRASNLSFMSDPLLEGANPLSYPLLDKI
jgi:hypothetical protein